MIKIGAFEAKTHLSSLLAKVAGGEEAVITKHGRPIAKLVSITVADEGRLDDVVAELKRLRKGTTLGGFSWKGLRDEGRR